MKQDQNQHPIERGNRAALLVVDVQTGLFKKSTPVYKAEILLENLCILINRARAAGIPVIYIQHADKHSLVEGSDDWLVHPQIRALEPDCTVHKRHPNAFEDTRLEEELASLGVGKVIVTGLVTHGCVRATCQSAKELGYDVILVKDGHSSFSKQAAELIEEWNQNLSEAGIEVKSTDQVVFAG